MDEFQGFLAKSKNHTELYSRAYVWIMTNLSQWSSGTISDRTLRNAYIFLAEVMIVEIERVNKLLADNPTPDREGKAR